MPLRRSCFPSAARLSAPHPRDCRASGTPPCRCAPPAWADPGKRRTARRAAACRPRRKPPWPPCPPGCFRARTFRRCQGLPATDPKKRARPGQSARAAAPGRRPRFGAGKDLHRNRIAGPYPASVLPEHHSIFMHFSQPHFPEMQKKSAEYLTNPPPAPMIDRSRRDCIY